MKSRYLTWLLLFFLLNSAFGQTAQQKAMQKLDFMVGDWLGTSTTFERDSVLRQVPAFEQIRYKLDQSILTIDLHSETLQLHTVIYYAPEDSTYYYQPYYKNGAGKYRAAFQDGKLIVSPSPTKRFIFERTPEGYFREYGEKYEKGRWIKYFEDIFKTIR